MCAAQFLQNLGRSAEKNISHPSQIEIVYRLMIEYIALELSDTVALLHQIQVLFDSPTRSDCSCNFGNTSIRIFRDLAINQEVDPAVFNTYQIQLSKIELLQWQPDFLLKLKIPLLYHRLRLFLAL